MPSRTETILRLLESSLGGAHARTLQSLRLGRLVGRRRALLPEFRAPRVEVARRPRATPERPSALPAARIGTVGPPARLPTLVRADGVRVDAAMVPFVQRLREEARRRRLPFRVVSGFRSAAEQAALRLRWERGDPGVIFPPAEHSFHEQGLAIDINPINTARALGPFGESLGMRWGGRFGDPVHFDLGGR